MTLRVQMTSGQADHQDKVFDHDFSIGRHPDCALCCQDPVVSRFHAEVSYDGKWWWIKDLNSANGTFLNGRRISFEKIPATAEVQIGKNGPLLHFAIDTDRDEPLQTGDTTPEGPTPWKSETQIIRHFFEDSDRENIGEQTMMFRRAFKKAQNRRSRKYLVLIAVSVVLLAAASAWIVYQHNKIAKLRATAVDIFYSMKALELEISHLEKVITQTTGTREAVALQAKKRKFSKLEETYDRFIKDIGVYQGLGPREKVILKVARIFGECELNVPPGFTAEVNRYIRKWVSTGRLKRAMRRAVSKGYDRIIAETFATCGLTPYFMFLALQESGFNPRAIGPKTRYGYAKGAWQFIPSTAREYGLKIGPLYQQKVYDPLDERFNFTLATRAAARYIRDIYNTRAQTSGLLVMASYNWGHNRVKKLIDRMPEDPRERNFWNLLKHTKIPRETYDYVFYIFSAAVICENPALFGVDLELHTLPRLDNHG